MKAVHKLTKYMGYLGAAVLFVMMMVTVVDVFLRYVFNAPIGGVTEVSALLLVIIAALGLGWCALERAHVKVDLITDHMPKKIRFVVVNIMMIIALLIYAIMTWYTFSESFKGKQFSSVLRIPMTPFLWVFWAGLVIFCVCILVVLIEDIRKGVEGES